MVLVMTLASLSPAAPFCSRLTHPRHSPTPNRRSVSELNQHLHRVPAYLYSPYWSTQSIKIIHSDRSFPWQTVTSTGVGTRASTTTAKAPNLHLDRKASNHLVLPNSQLPPYYLQIELKHMHPDRRMAGFVKQHEQFKTNMRKGNN